MRRRHVEVVMELLLPRLGIGALVCALASCTTSPARERSASPPSSRAVAPPADADDLLAVPLPDDPLGVTVHALSNGMRVYISTDDTRPQIDAHVVVKAGARQEPEEATELAHYLEHMMFKGTDRLGTTNWAEEEPHLRAIEDLYDELADAQGASARDRILRAIDAETQAAAPYVAPNEIWSLFEALGAGNINARTGNEVTVYDVWGLPSERLETWAEIEAERFRAPAFRLFFPELEAVYEERNLHADDPGWRHAEAVARVAWGGHPNARVSNPKPEHLRTPAFGAMKEFFDRWYTPSNLAVVLVGDVTPAEALPVLERTLGTLDDRGRPNKARVPATHGPAGRRESIDGERPELSLLWRTVPVDHADIPALLVLNDLVINREVGLLGEMFDRTHRIDGTWCSLDVRPEGGYWQLHGDVRAGQTHDSVQAALLEVVVRLRAGDFDADDIEAVKVQKEVQRKRSLEELDGRTEEIVESMLDGMTWGAAVETRRARAQVTKEDVIAVANSYLDPAAFGRVATVEGTPPRDQLETPPISALKLDQAARSQMAERLLAREYAEVSPVFPRPGEHYVESSHGGVRYVSVHNARNDLFEVAYRFEIGSADDPLLCDALESAVDAWSSSNETPAGSAAPHQLGAAAWTHCTERSSEVRFRGLDRSFDATGQIVKESLAAPRIDGESFAQQIEATIAARRRAMRDPDTLAAALWEYAVRGDESSFLRAPTDAQLRAKTPADARASVLSLLGLPHHAGYYGPRSADEARDTVALGETAADPPEPSPQRLLAPAQPTITIVGAETSTAEIWITWAGGVAMNHASAFAYLADDYFGSGMSSLLLQELRESRALVYTAGASTMVEERRGDDSAMFVWLSTAPGKAGDALSAALEVMGRSVDAQRYASVHEALVEKLRRWRPQPRRLPSRVAWWRAAGWEGEPAASRWEELQSDAADASAFEAFRARLVAPPPAITIVGDIEAMDLDALRELAEVKVVERDALFGYD